MSASDSPSDRWKRISRLTAQALELPPERRASWLDEACAGDDPERREIESLLAAAASAGTFLERAALADEGAAQTIAALARESVGLTDGTAVGPYRIVRELGHGGMGVVYLAERADAAFAKQVAIKIVRAGFSPDAEPRFRRERHILATLEHPNIARLLDGGTTSQGLSYLVMEYVDGVPVDTYCDTRQLFLPARLELFRTICAAIQYAHHRLVIHRDIKPRNILVTADGTPKLLDFGIARLVDGDGSTDHTHTATRVFTLETSSPEQLDGEAMAVTSDVYSLGVLLYRLVTGSGPYSPTPLDDVRLMRAIRDQPPLPPAKAARAGTGFTVSADLEWILLKALRKEPDRRYASVEQLADDVRRLLEGRPVLAAPDSRAYRARKFMARHRLGVMAAALIVVSLVAGLAATLWQARRAEAQRAIAEQHLQQTRRLANAMIFEVNDALETGVTSARALLLKRASEQLDVLAADLPEDPILAEELATAYHRLGDVLGTTGNASTGNRKEGLANHRKGLSIRQRLVARAPNDLEARYRLVDSLISATYAEDEVGPSFEHARAAVAASQALVQARPDEARFRSRLGSALYVLGSQHRAIGETTQAFEAFARATPYFEEAYQATPTPSVRGGLALCYKRLGAILVERSAFEKASTYLHKAVALDTVSFTEHPKAARARRDLSTSNTQLGWAELSAGHPRDALVFFQRALELRRTIAADDPTNQQAPRDIALALWYIGRAQLALGTPEAALDALQEAYALKLTERDASDDLPSLIAGTLAESHEKTGHATAAIDLWRVAVSQLQRNVAAQPANGVARRDFAAQALGLGRTLVALPGQDASRRDAAMREGCATLSDAQRALEGLAERTSDDARLLDQIAGQRRRCP